MIKTFEAEGQKFAKNLRSLEQFIHNRPILVKLLHKWYFASKIDLTYCE